MVIKIFYRINFRTQTIHHRSVTMTNISPEIENWIGNLFGLEDVAVGGGEGGGGGIMTILAQILTILTQILTTHPIPTSSPTIQPLILCFTNTIEGDLTNLALLHPHITKLVQ